MGIARIRWVLFLGVLSILLTSTLAGLAGAQGIQQSPYSAPSLLRGSSTGGLGLAPSNPLGMPGSSMPGAGGSSSLCLTDGMFRGILPLIPNLQLGYLYYFGNNRVSTGRFTADYLLPLGLSPDSVIFGEAHAEFQDFWKTSNFNNRGDMSFGGGYRTLVKRDTLLGVNGFYDTSRLGGTWYSSGGIGFEMAALVGSSDAIDLNFNWYGQLFNSIVIINAFRYGPSNFDVQAGYSHELWNGGPDLRLKMTGYKFDIGNSVYGWNGGAELKSRDGMFVLKYDAGHDQVNQTYQTVGGLVNVGFQLENLFRGESPFTMPEPIFRSPRSLRYMLTQPVKREWHQPTAVVRGCSGQCCNLDRFLASVTMVPSGPQAFVSHAVPFPPVPYACLDPTKHIVVEFDYIFDVAPGPGLGSWDVEVQNSSGTRANAFIGNAPIGQSGHISFELNTSDQSVFTTSGADPASVVIDIFIPVAPFPTMMTVTNVAIHSNQ